MHRESAALKSDGTTGFAGAVRLVAAEDAVIELDHAADAAGADAAAAERAFIVPAGHRHVLQGEVKAIGQGRIHVKNALARHGLLDGGRRGAAPWMMVPLPVMSRSPAVELKVVSACSSLPGPEGLVGANVS